MTPHQGNAPAGGLRQVYIGLFEVLSDVHWTIKEQIADNDKVVSRFAWTATHSGLSAGIPVAGKTLKVKGVVIDHFVDGMMIDSRILTDDLGCSNQLGIIPAAPAA